MLQIIEISKLQNLLATYRLQTANGILVMANNGGWEQDPDGNWHKITYPSNAGYGNRNSGGGGDCDCCDALCCGTATACCCLDCITC